MRSILLCAAVLFGVACALDTYIVVMKPNSPLALIDTLTQSILGLVLGPLAKFTIGSSFSGFTTVLTPLQVSLLSINPNVSRHHILIFREPSITPTSTDDIRSNTSKKMELLTYSAHCRYASELRRRSRLEFGAWVV
jgi:hypothetical protein